MGFCFLDLASNYEPPAELVEWLEAGDKPIYIGFGSLVSVFFFLLICISIGSYEKLKIMYLLFCLFVVKPVQEPEKMTEIIVEALQRTKQRGIINKGWGGLGNCRFLNPYYLSIIGSLDVFMFGICYNNMCLMWFSYSERTEGLRLLVG